MNKFFRGKSILIALTMTMVLGLAGCKSNQASKTPETTEDVVVTETETTEVTETKNTTDKHDTSATSDEISESLSETDVTEEEKTEDTDDEDVATEEELKNEEEKQEAKPSNGTSSGSSTGSKPGTGTSTVNGSTGNGNGNGSSGNSGSNGNAGGSTTSTPEPTPTPTPEPTPQPQVCQHTNTEDRIIGNTGRPIGNGQGCGQHGDLYHTFCKDCGADLGNERTVWGAITHSEHSEVIIDDYGECGGSGTSHIHHYCDCGAINYDDAPVTSPNPHSMRTIQYYDADGNLCETNQCAFCGWEDGSDHIIAYASGD